MLSVSWLTIPSRPTIPKWQKEDYVDVIGRAYYRDKKKKRVKQASGWKVVGREHGYTIKSATDGRHMVIFFGGVHPVAFNFPSYVEMRRFYRRILLRSGLKGDKKGRFYLGKT